MTQLILIRHAQASFGSDNYDQLSPLGLQQASWLGEHLSRRGQFPARMIGGTLKRHQQTAHNIMQKIDKDISFEQDSCWNEFEFKGVIQAYISQHPEAEPNTIQASAQPKDLKTKVFFSLLKKAMLAWSHNELDDYNGESWGEFDARVNEAFSKIQTAETKEPIWLISSGGVIAMLLKQILDVNSHKMIDLNFQIRNTSMTDVYFKPNKKALAAFNQVPHLDHSDRLNAVTYA